MTTAITEEQARHRLEWLAPDPGDDVLIKPADRRAAQWALDKINDLKSLHAAQQGVYERLLIEHGKALACIDNLNEWANVNRERIAELEATVKQQAERIGELEERAARFLADLIANGNLPLKYESQIHGRITNERNNR